MNDLDKPLVFDPHNGTALIVEVEFSDLVAAEARQSFDRAIDELLVDVDKRYGANAARRGE